VQPKRTAPGEVKHRTRREEQLHRNGGGERGQKGGGGRKKTGAVVAAHGEVGFERTTHEVVDKSRGGGEVTKRKEGVTTQEKDFFREIKSSKRGSQQKKNNGLWAKPRKATWGSKL